MRKVKQWMRERVFVVRVNMKRQGRAKSRPQASKKVVAKNQGHPALRDIRYKIYRNHLTSHKEKIVFACSYF